MQQRSIDPFHNQWIPLDLNPSQQQIATTRTQTGYRRVKGPAGSGKSLALAARAAVLLSEDKRVLVCTYNITLKNLLNDFVTRYANDQRLVLGGQIECYHFHDWCKDVCEQTRYGEDYKNLWNNFPKPQIWRHRMAELVSGIYEDPSISNVLPNYDAILVDEGQDYRLIWWQTLRKAIVPGGEMLLVADKTQNLYGTAQAWTEEAMIGCGFSGPWRTLEDSYRLPAGLIPILQQYAALFLTPYGEEIDIPPVHDSTQIELLDQFRWVQVSLGGPMDVCVEEVMRLLKQGTVIPNLTFLSEVGIGRAVVNKLREIRILYSSFSFEETP